MKIGQKCASIFEAVPVVISLECYVVLKMLYITEKYDVIVFYGDLENI